MDAMLQKLFEAILEGDREATEEGVRSGLEAGFEAARLLDEAMIPAMREVGRLFEKGEYFVPEMLISARAMQGGLALLRPLLAEQEAQPAGRALIATVHGDLHDIGKNLVSLMLEGAGFEVHDLGVDVTAEEIARAAAEEQPDILGLSAMLTTTMKEMQNVIEALQAAGLRDQVRVIVGGAPLTESFARQIGADGYAPDASRAVALAQALLAAKEAR